MSTKNIASFALLVLLLVLPVVAAEGELTLPTQAIVGETVEIIVDPAYTDRAIVRIETESGLYRANVDGNQLLFVPRREGTYGVFLLGRDLRAQISPSHPQRF